MRKCLLLVFLACAPLLCQTTPQSLMVTRIFNVTATWAGECAAGAINNTSRSVRRNNYHTLYVNAASGTWSASLSYSDASCSGPWTTFGTPSQVTQASAIPLIGAVGYHPYLLVTITGNANATYSAAKDFFATPSSSSGPAGPGVPTGGTTGQVLGKLSSTDFDTAWLTPSGSGGPATWGQITGTLALQSDLTNALNGKAATSHTHNITDVLNLTTVLAGKVDTSTVGQPNGIPPLDVSGKIPNTFLPSTSGMTALIQDTNPQLGGALDMNGFSIQTVTPTEMTRVHGVTSAIQAQIDGKSALNHNHAGVYEPVDPTILRQGNLAGSGAAVTPARSDHNHSGVYIPVAGAFSDLSTNAKIGTGSAQVAAGNHTHAGVYEPVDPTILRQANLAGSGTAVTPARSDHNHTGVYAPALHATNHANTGSDPITIVESQVFGLLTDLGLRVTVVGGGALANGAVMVGGGTTTGQTPNANTKVDSSGNFTTPGTVAGGVGGTGAGYHAMQQGTLPVFGGGAGQIPLAGWIAWGGAPSGVTTSYGLIPPLVGPNNQVMVCPPGVSGWSQCTWAANGAPTQGPGITVVAGQVSIDSAVTETRANDVAGQDKLLAPSSNNGAHYIACPTSNTPLGNAIGGYTDGMVLNFKPDVSGTPGAVDLNVCTLGARSIKESNGVTDPVFGDITAGKFYLITYDASLSLFKLPAAGGSSGACQWLKYAVTISAGNWQVNGANPPGGAVALVGTGGPQTVNLVNLGAQSIVHGGVIKNATAWLSATGATVSIGSDAGTTTSFLPAFDPTQSVASTTFGLAGSPYTPTFASQNMTFTVQLGAGNISAMNASNAVNIWACVATLP